MDLPMSLRLPLLLFLSAFFLFAPLSAFAQGTGSMFDPIIPDGCKCASVTVEGGSGTSPSAASWGCVLKVVQNVINTAVGVMVIVVVLAIVYGAFILMTRGANPQARTQARNVMLNSVLGLFILLGAWLAVDFVMKIVYNKDAVFSGGTALGPWNAIWAGNGDDMCLVVRQPTPIATGVVGLMRDVYNGGGSTGGSFVPGVGACSPATVQAAGAQGGATLSTGEASFFACVARPESRCGTQLQNYNWGRGSSAYGPFQILLGDNAQYFENAACYQAAGVSGPLNCASGFRNGNPIPGREAIVNQCRRAAANLSCSTAAAHRLFQASGHSPWTRNRDSTSKHQECIRLIGS